jgi:hypothetical protein
MMEGRKEVAKAQIELRVFSEVQIFFFVNLLIIKHDINCLLYIINFVLLPLCIYQVWHKQKLIPNNTTDVILISNL